MTQKRQHYWLRTDFENAVGMWGALGSTIPRPTVVDLEYPKTAEQVVAELQLRGIDLRACAMRHILDHRSTCIHEVRELSPDPRAAQWERRHLDALADWLDSMEIWTPTTHLCALLNVSYHQFIRSYWVAAARFGVGRPFAAPVDLSQLVIVVQPPARDDDYARIDFYPKGTGIISEEVTA